MAWLRHKVETKTSASWNKRAQAVVPVGAGQAERSPLGPVQSLRYFASGSGPWLEDVDGNRYIDLTGGGGAMILGYGAPRVTEALCQTASLGLGAANPATPAILLAEQLRQRVGPVDKTQLVGDHAAATTLAVRLAQRRTGRRSVIVFAGCYHGNVPGLLAVSDPSAKTIAPYDPERPCAPGGGDVIALPYGDIGPVAAAFAARSGGIACVLAEAAPTHMGAVPAPIGFNAQLAKLCRERDCLFILDETVTGFRASATGQFGLEGQKEGWSPDLMVLGGVIGGGLPIGAVGGTEGVMELLRAGGVDWAGGEAAGPLACAAGLATLAGCDAALYRQLTETSAALQELIAQELDASGVAYRIQAAGGGFSVSFGAEPVANLADARAKRLGQYRVFAQALLQGGVRAPSSPFATWFVSGAHDATALEHIAAALPHAARSVAKAARSS